MGLNVTNPAAAAAATGSGKSFCLGAKDIPQNTQTAPKNQALSAPKERLDHAKLDLVRELLDESLGFARVYASVAQQLAEIGDYRSTLDMLRNFLRAAGAARDCGTEIRKILEEGLS